MRSLKRLAAALGLSLPPPSTGERVAFLISGVGSPFMTPLYTASVLVGTVARSLREFALWVSLVCVFFVGLGLGYVIMQVVRGKISDLHVSDASQRAGPFGVAVCGSLAGLIGLWWMAVPWPLVALGTSFVVQASCFGLLTRWSKISMHVAVAAACVTTLVWFFAWAAVPLIALLPLQGWARMRRGRHTLRQVVTGAVLAPVLTVLTLLPWWAAGFAR
jgi:hypothetical protein